MPPNSLPDPVVRFRLRTLLMVTTAFAVLAAIAGPVYRAASVSGQRSLLLFWSLLLAACVLSVVLRYRDTILRATPSNVRFVVYSRGVQKTRHGIGWTLAGVLGPAVAVTWMTYEVGFRRQDDHALFTAVYWGVFMGSMLAASIFSYMRRPLYLCDDGVPLAKGHHAPWKYIRGAEWLSPASGAMRLHRYDGDIYIEAPTAIRNEVEAFVRQKTGSDVMISANN